MYTVQKVMMSIDWAVVCVHLQFKIFSLIILLEMHWFLLICNQIRIHFISN